MNLQEFGHRLQTLRTTAGYTQDQLIDALQSLVAPGPREAYRELDAPLISRWESGSPRGKRKWKPTRVYMLTLIALFADQLTPEAARQWAAHCGYTFSASEIETLLPQRGTTTDPPDRQTLQQQPSLPDDYVSRTRLEQLIWRQLSEQQVVALFGPGGTGKTTLASWAAHRLATEKGRGVIWIDDCRCKDGAFHVFEAQDRIAHSLAVELPNGALAERAAALRTLLQSQSNLIVLDDVWPSDNLEHLRVQSHESPLMITTRNATVAHRLGPTQPITINGMTPSQARALLYSALHENIDSDLTRVLSRVDHLPLAVALIKMLLQEGYAVSELLSAMRADNSALEILALEQEPNRATNLRACFDLSYNHLALPAAQQRFAQLSCFSGAFSVAAAAGIWKVSPTLARRQLDGLVRKSLVQREEGRYRLQRLLRDYALQKLKADWPAQVESTYRRHSAFYLRHRLAHPQILVDVTEAPPAIERSWLNIREAIHWAVENAPDLAAVSTVLAHTERAALLDAVGPPLLAAIQTYSTQLSNGSAQALLAELSGDLYLLQQNQSAAFTAFATAETLWLGVENKLASSRTKLRQAGIHLLNQDCEEAAETMRQAQILLAQALPLAPPEMPTARRLLYWFDLLYAALVRWPDLPHHAVANLTDLAAQMGDEAMTARGLHIYRMWCTAPTLERPAAIRTLGRKLAEDAIRLWWIAGDLDKADQEELWSEYQLTGRCFPDVVQRFAVRLSSQTPQLSPNQIKLIPQAGIRWWLETDESQRIEWLSAMLPRYLQATNGDQSPLRPNSQAWRWVREIIGQVGSLHRESRRLPKVRANPPSEHFLNAPEWRVFSGQRAFSLVDKESEAVVQEMVGRLDAELSVGV